MYKVDPNDPKKSAPKQLVFDNPSGIAVLLLMLCTSSNPTAGTMTYSLASDKIFIYNGTAWKTWTRD